jgi:hypothetical protein
MSRITYPAIGHARSHRAFVIFFQMIFFETVERGEESGGDCCDSINFCLQSISVAPPSGRDDRQTPCLNLTNSERSLELKLFAGRLNRSTRVGTVCGYNKSGGVYRIRADAKRIMIMYCSFFSLYRSPFLPLN